MARVFTQTFGVVAAILEREGKILLVKESLKGHPDNGKWSHPAGWIDVGEDPVDAIKREVKEEAGLDFEPRAILGIYSLVRCDIEKQLNGTPHAIKISFRGDITSLKQAKLSADTSETKWFSPEEIFAMDGHALRDTDIKQEVKDYFAGKSFPLSLLTHTIQT